MDSKSIDPFLSAPGPYYNESIWWTLTELYEPASDATISTMPANIVNHSLNCVFGSIFGVLNIPLFIVLTSTKEFRSRYLILIVLCLADSSNCVANFLMGLNRVILYSNVVTYKLLPIRSSWFCAWEPWLIMRIIGDLWPPAMVVMIGLERGICVYAPMLYKRIEGLTSRIIMSAITIAYVIGVLSYGLTNAWDMRMEKQKYYCGRKASFSTEFGQFVYCSNVVCYFFGFFICVAAYVKCRSVPDMPIYNIQRVRYTLMISFLSAILVSTPNVMWIFETFMPMPTWVQKPTVYASSINSGINIFVYLAMNAEFRARFNSIFRLSRHTETSIGGTTIDRSPRCPSRMENSVIKVSWSK